MHTGVDWPRMAWKAVKRSLAEEGRVRKSDVFENAKGKRRAFVLEGRMLEKRKRTKGKVRKELLN